MRTINISNDFSSHIGLRYRKLGDYSGEEFREDILIPALDSDSNVIVELDGTKGYGPSFLEEAFGGAVRAGYALTEDRLTLVSEDQSLIEQIWIYINKAMKS